MKSIWTILGLSLAVAVAVAGCGGGGSGSSSAGAQSVGVFVTDSFSDDYDHVWATLYKVELLSAEGMTQTLFDDPAGRSVDLKTLRDGSGPRFLFLENATVRPGNHTRVRVTIGSSLVLFPTGSTTGQDTPIADSFPRVGQDQAVIEFPLGVLRNLASGNDNLVIDFDLANFLLVSGKVTPSCREGERTGLTDGRRHESAHYEGTVAGFAGQAPSFSFSLTRPDGTEVRVVTDANTALVNSDGAPSPALANGKRVVIEGTFDATSEQLTAREIKILVANPTGEVSLFFVAGAPSNVNPTAGTFVVEIRKAERFVPTQATVNVVTQDGTVFWAESGATLEAVDFFVKLGSVPGVMVWGTYDEATNTLTAARVKLPQPEVGVTAPRVVELRATVSEVDPAAGTFKLGTLAEWEGLMPPGALLTVKTNGETMFLDAAEHPLTAAEFFAALAVGGKVKVIGTFTAGTVTATRLRLLP